MRHISLLAVSLLALAACTPEKQQEADDYTQYVNPFIGTDFTGNTYPGAQVPFGMVQLSPDNGLPGWDRISGYFYPDTTIAGFSHTHLSGTGAGDLYDISFMPVTRPYKEAPAPLGVYSTFSHNDEMASAGYYRVLLKDYNINVELTATERCGIQRYTFPKAEASVFLNLKKAMNWDFTLDSYIEVVDSMTIRGYRFSQGWSPLQHVYFETRFSKPFMACHMDTTSIVTKDRGRIGTAYIARFDFNTEKDEEILVTTGISGVSMEGAGKNLRAEVSKDDFDYYQAQAAKTWNKQLSKIEVKSSDTDDLVKFYTALYHSMIAPTIYSDVDGSYYGPDQQIHKADGWTNYSTFSLWDTYRASHPLFTYTEPERANDMIKGFLKFYEQNGALPLWNLYGWETNMMIGYHAVPVIVDAYLKGIGNFDPEKALEACIATANRDDYRGIGDYKKLGYVPPTAIPRNGRTGRYPRHWNMLMMIIVLQQWQRRWARKRSPMNSTNVLRTTGMFIIRPLLSCSRVTRKGTSLQTSAPTTIPKISVKVMAGNISGLYLRIWTVWSAWSEARNVSLRNWTVCSPTFRNRQKTCRSSVPV